MRMVEDELGRAALIERERAVASLVESKGWFSQFADGLTQVIWLFSPDHACVLYVNAAYERVWMRSTAELYRQPGSWLEGVHPEDRGRVAQEIAASPSGGCGEMEYRVARADLSIRWIHARTFPIRGALAEVECMACVAEDVTLLKEAAALAGQKEAALRGAERVGQVGSWELDLITNTLTWSEQTYQIFGWRTDEFLLTRESFYQALHPADRERTRTAITQSIRERIPYQIEYRIVRPDGSLRVVLAQAGLLADAEGQPLRMVGTVQDLTERRRLEEQFHQAQKMEVIGLLAGGVAHDFNNLLTVIRGRAEMVLADERLSTQSGEYLNQLVEATDRAAHLTRQLVAFKRKQSAQLQLLDLNTIIQNLTKMLGRIIGEDIHLQVQLAASLPLVRADTGLIEQVLLNLAFSARQAMPQGGRVTIKTEAVSVNFDLEPRSGRSGQGTCVRLTVQDTAGSGAPTAPSSTPEPLFTSGEAGKETGLGLSAVYGVVAQLQGWIDAEARAASGRTFSLFFPAGSEAKTSVPCGSKVNGVRGGSEKILLVEDDRPLRRFMLLLLTRLGYAVREAGTGPEAIHAWKEANGQFDLLLTDMVMPAGLRGRDLVQQLRENEPRLRALIFTSYNKDAPAEESPSEERIRILVKPLTPEVLAQAVRDCLDAP